MAKAAFAWAAIGRSGRSRRWASMEESERLAIIGQLAARKSKIRPEKLGLFGG